MKIRFSMTGLTLIAALLLGMAPPSVCASGSGPEEEKPIRLVVSDRFGPIGKIRTNSLVRGTAAIDERVATDGEMIWGGEVITALADQKVSVAVGSIGDVALGRGAMVRLSTARTVAGDASHEILVASLLRGRIYVNLDQAAGAYIEAAGSAFTATPGSRFNVEVENGRASLRTVSGAVRTQNPTPPQDVNIRIVDELGRPVSSGSQLSVRARSTRQIQVQVTDKNDKPIPDLPVLFSLGNPCLGSLGLGLAAGSTLTQKTDNRGIAAVPLVAGAARCAASIIAKVEGTNASVSIQTNVVQQRGFWNTQNTLLVVAAAAAAGVTIGLVVANRNDEPIRPVPPPQIRP